ncbi:dihydrodipicolinate synthase family protein [Roseovarius sp. M141]|uniref:dihydrodipicolinate synthase family protein n=1 Tax=Roseovarius sp. M141 TaxID=2583806 RepID=UPI0020CFDE4A|nr:dihydrodipicolinate synthase family protein [Roseovarius sp. M141]MCQ0090623.1 dihydrodipicolinate synthase family protein [Roseovarius sp. M141]
MPKLTQPSLENVASVLSQGVIVPTLTPFNDSGAVLADAITDQTRRLTRIDGLVGIAVNTADRERDSLTLAERSEVIRRTREGLDPGRLLLAHVGTLSNATLEEIETCQSAGADAVIGSAGDWQQGRAGGSVDERLDALTDLTDRLSLPVIVALDGDRRCRIAFSEKLINLARHCDNVIGFVLGADDDVVQYDQNYYALKSIGRPLACLTSSAGALFHNLNTGADGVLSPLAQLAPYEVAALYQASRSGRFFDAQALHNRLSPLIGLLSGHDDITRERICREIAHHRGLLATPEMRGVADPLSDQLMHRIHQTVEETGLDPVSWV